MMKIRTFFFLVFLLAAGSVGYAQRVLSLDSCRVLAQRNNKQLQVSRFNKEMTANARRSARTQYLPKVDVVAGYEYFNREVNLLSNTQKSALGNIGTTSVQQFNGDLGTAITNRLTGMVQQGTLTMQQAQQMSALMQELGTPLSQYAAAMGNSIGEKVVDALHTDTHSLFGGSVTLRQPLYMGGAIIAANKMADIADRMADDRITLQIQSTIHNIDQAYWTVVSLRQKQRLAYSFRDLVVKLNDDVQKMLEQGVATRADALKVQVRLNEADMQITQVDDGLTLARMLLCQLCGLPIDEPIVLEDESRDRISTAGEPSAEALAVSDDLSNRPEIRLLQSTVELGKQNTRLVRAAYLPHLALTGGYSVTNPNVFNGFQKKFSGVWNVGVLLQVPVWNWLDSKYKVRASKAVTRMADMELADMQEKISLQITQSRFKVAEADKKLAMAEKNIASADENLRSAQVGFREGVMESTDVLAAQTAWQQAQSQLIDAQIDVRLARVNLDKALGILQ